MELVLNGAMVSGSMIVAIGGQNSFVLKQGLLRNNIFWVAITCFLCDVMLMTMGVMGLGSSISQSRPATLVMATAGALFLAWYGWRAFASALRTASFMEATPEDLAGSCVRKTLLATLVVTLFNPQVYLDTVLIVGGVAATLEQDQKLEFLTGALLASLGWFFGLGYGARFLRPLFRDVRTWRLLDIFTGGTMWWVSIKLMSFGLAAWQS